MPRPGLSLCLGYCQRLLKELGFGCGAESSGEGAAGTGDKAVNYQFRRDWQGVCICRQSPSHKMQGRRQLEITVEEVWRKTQDGEYCGFWQQQEGFCSICRSAPAEQTLCPGSVEDKHPKGCLRTEPAETALNICRNGKGKQWWAASFCRVWRHPSTDVTCYLERLVVCQEPGSRKSQRLPQLARPSSFYPCYSSTQASIIMP